MVLELRISCVRLKNMFFREDFNTRTPLHLINLMSTATINMKTRPTAPRAGGPSGRRCASLDGFGKIA